MKQIIKKYRLVTTLILLTFVLAVIILGINYYKKDPAIAKINGTKIYKSEIDKEIGFILQNTENSEDQKLDIYNLPQTMIESIASDIYLQKQLDKIISKSEIPQDPVIKEHLAEYEKQILRKAYLEDIGNKNISDEKTKNEYSKLFAELSGKKEMHIKHILLKTKAEAQKISQKLKKNRKSFDDLAEKHSTDTANAKFGGDLGYIMPDNLDEDFSNALLSLKKNQISNPIKTQFGWHIIYVKNIRKFTLPPFDEIKPTIEEKLRQEAVEKVLSSINKNNKVEILIEFDETSKKAVPDEKEQE